MPSTAKSPSAAILAWALLGSLVATTTLSARAARAGDSDDVRLDRGEVLVHTRPVPGSDTPVFVGRGVIDVPPAQLWALAQDCGRYAGRLPRVVRSRELSREGPVAICETTSKPPFPLGEMTSVTRAVHEVTVGRWTRRWTLVRGDYDLNSGAWILTPFGPTGQRTLLTYEVQVEPKLPVPAWLQRRAQARGMPDLYEHLRVAMTAVGAH